MKAFIFDLDGVIVDTAKYHFIAWKSVGEKFNYTLTHAQNEQLKGISRADSLDLILDWANVTLTAEEKEIRLREKNEHYLQLIEELKEDEILPGVLLLLNFAKENKTPTALGSSSKNAIPILQKLGLMHYFDTIVDGTQVTHSKPNPEGFLLCAKNLNVTPSQCIVFEDAAAGVIAAKSAEMTAIGIGNPIELEAADYIFDNLGEIDINFINTLL